MINLKEKRILITGGSRGIGLEIVKTLATEYAHIGFTYRSRPKEVQNLAEKLSAELDTKVVAYQSDAIDFEQAGTLMAQFCEDFGGIDVLINNAGITQDNLLLRMSEEQWDQVINVNLKSAFNLTKHALRPMMKARKGSIIHISSVVGVMGNPGQTNYAASKAGMIGFSKSIAKEVGSRNIRSNVIAPGYIETEMTASLSEEVRANFMANIPLGRMGTGEDVANVVAFLASDRSAYINGQVLPVCGGLLM